MEDEILNDFLVESKREPFASRSGFVQWKKIPVIGAAREYLSHDHTIRNRGILQFRETDLVTHSRGHPRKMRDGKMKADARHDGCILAASRGQRTYRSHRATSGEGSKDYSDVVKKLERVANCDAPAAKSSQRAPGLPKEHQLGAFAHGRRCASSGPSSPRRRLS